ncbi:hypothetical protein WJX84_006177 [Apatococcus fuscideae]|uniref:GCK domain-containing protein n=1 Tax=Apatococcus fuscideae TaxID=2026836 RepID=A0AAW1SQH6_9CHLO
MTASTFGNSSPVHKSPNLSTTIQASRSPGRPSPPFQHSSKLLQQAGSRVCLSSVSGRPSVLQALQGWETCVDQARGQQQDFTEGCREQTQALQQCMLDNREYYAPLLEGQTLASDAAAESSEDHSEAAVLADDMAENKQDEPTPDQPTETEGPQPEPEVHQSGAAPSKQQESLMNIKEDEGGTSNESNPRGHDEDGSKPNDSSQPADGASQGNDSQFQEDDSRGNEEAEDSSGSGEPFDIPHAGGEDKTGMPGEPEPEPEEEEGGGEIEEEEEPAPPEVKVESTPFDVRFPGTNQARHCYTRYNEYHKCAKQNGEEDERCNVFQKAYRSICPGEWVERWNEQRETGTWPGRW